MSHRTAVIVGVGQVANKDPDRILHPDDLLHGALDLALADAGHDVRSRIDGLYVTPPTHDDAPTSLARLRTRSGLHQGRGEIMRWSGSGPQEGLNHAVSEIVAGRLEAAVLVAGVGDASARRARQAGLEPPGRSTGLEQNTEVDPDVPRQPNRQGPEVETAAGIRAVGTSFAMVESVFAAEAGRSLDEQRIWLGGLMAPFTSAAARRPNVAWFPNPRQAEEISAVSVANRLVNEPYTKVMNAFPTVDLAASVLVTTTEVARACGIPEGQWVYPWVGTTCHEPAPPSERPFIHRSGGLSAALERALISARLNVEDIDLFDFYSCFPSAVQMSAAAIGLDPLDPRGLTVTGGLPYFGGPGAAYVCHAIVSMVEECRTRPDGVGMVVGLGGLISHFAAGIYSGAEPPQPWRFDGCSGVEAELDQKRVPVDLAREGVAEVEAMTVAHNRTGVVNAPVIVKFGDGTRSGAQPRSREMARDLSGINLVGSKVRIGLEAGGPRFEPI
ncbi:MAG TPA: hypothetical protein VNF50_10270 [Acidimicrobiales bacterium]|nr:hypothetical protein [Acidimicrobiales bacterium]